MLTVCLFLKNISLLFQEEFASRGLDVIGYLKTWLKATYHLVKCRIDVVCKLDLTNRLPPHCS